MRFFRIDTLGDPGDLSLALIDREPGEIEEYGYRLAMGEPLGFEVKDARVYLNPYRRGMVMPDILGNTICYLIVHERIQAVIAEHVSGPVDFIPLEIYNQKRRPHATNYWIVNPCIFVNCLDHDASEIERMPAPDTGIVGIDKYVFLDTERAPALFRIPESSEEIFMTETLARALVPLKPTNLRLFEIETSGGATR